MMKAAITLVVGAALSLSAHAGIEECSLNGESVSPSNGSTTAGKTGVMRCKDRESGEMLNERELKHGVFMGLERFYRNGKLQRERYINEKGNSHGKAKEFAANGQLILEENYVNAQERGISQRWNEKGQLIEVRFRGENPDEKAMLRFNPDKSLAEFECGKKPLLGNYANDAEYCGFKGKPVTTKLYSEAGKLRSEFVLQNGEAQRAVFYRQDGSTESIDEVSNGKRSEKQFFANGKLRREKAWFNANRPLIIEREAEYHESGSKTQERLYQQVEKEGRKYAELRQETQFYLNGQNKTLVKYSYEAKNEIRDSQSFYDNGKLSEQGRSISEGRYNRRYVGIHQFFSNEGKLQRELHYDDQGKMQRERVWDANGKLQSDDLLFEDGSRKAYGK